MRVNKSEDVNKFGSQEYGCAKYTPTGHWTDVVRVEWEIGRPSFKDGEIVIENKVSVNWSALGSVSILQAKEFWMALNSAIADAEGKARELGISL